MDALTILGVAAVVIPSITTHEAAHAWLAGRLGDPTARMMGRITLNPIPHIDPFFTILLPGALLFSGSPFVFGGAKPVPVRVDQLRHPRRDWALVGAAGPVSNVLMAFLLAGALAALLQTEVVEASSRTTTVLSIGIFVNVLLAIFNLIPIPPLDGSRVFQFFLSDPALQAYHKLEQFGLLIVVGLVFFVEPFQRFLQKTIFGALDLVTSVFGVDQEVSLAIFRVFSA